jgi:hypothetical protein
MPRIAERKIHAYYYESILDGSKTYELRPHDKELAECDILRLVEVDPLGAPTGRGGDYKVTAKMSIGTLKPDYDDFQPENFMAMSITPVKQLTKAETLAALAKAEEKFKGDDFLIEALGILAQYIGDDQIKIVLERY